MSNATRNILLDCERMKYPYTGLYYYCLHLGKSLLKEVPNDLGLCFYVPGAAGPVFGPDACYLQQRTVHKLILPQSRFQLWHSTHQASDYFPWKRKMKVLLTIHDLNFLYDPSKSDAKKKKYLAKMKEKIDRADHIVAISNFTLADIRRHLDIGDKPCSVIYNGSNIEEIASLQPPQYRPLSPFYFTIGTILEKKNFHVLPALLLKNRMQLVISGITQSEEYKNRIISEARKLGVADRLVFTGTISENDKQWYLKNCAAFVFPSLSEGFGLPVVEAMHFGKPVLSAKTTSLPEIGGEHAYYFENFDPEHMNQLAREALSGHTPEKAREIREWSAQFEWKASARKYLQLYHQLLNDNP
jgi:glycosyltransferase involved in cell wall biosynthesis